MSRKPAKPVTRMVIETFRNPFNYTLTEMTRDKPSSWNGEVSVRKYRVTAKLIDEPVEVIAERIRELWRECDNHHHWGPLRAAAESCGIELDFADCGKANKKTGA